MMPMYGNMQMGGMDMGGMMMNPGFNMGMGGMQQMGMGGMQPMMGMGGMPQMGMGGMQQPMGMGGMPQMNMQNLMMDMNNMNNMNIQGMNVGGNENWLQGYNVVKPNPNNNIGGNKINCIFNTTTGRKINILIDHGKTIHDLIKIYFARVETPELINRDQDICFVYNATKLNFKSTEKVENFFKFNANPTILVNDIKELIGARK